MITVELTFQLVFHPLLCSLISHSHHFDLLTGVTKFSQVSVFSGFNQPDDISMDEHYEALCGITEEELYSTFEEQIKAMAVRYKTTEEGMKYKLKRKFDGYHFSSNMLDIYNPFSILNSLSKRTK